MQKTDNGDEGNQCAEKSREMTAGARIADPLWNSHRRQFGSVNDSRIAKASVLRVVRRLGERGLLPFTSLTKN